MDCKYCGTVIINGIGMHHSADCPAVQMAELSMIIRRFVHKCRKAGIEAVWCDRTMDYLKRKGLQGSPLRGDDVPTEEGK